MQLHVSTAQWRAPVPSMLSGSFGLLGMATVHMFDTPSSIRPLQLSSLPLHTSAGGTVDAMMLTIAVSAALASVSETRTAVPVPPAAAMVSFAAPVVVSVMT